MVEFFIRSLLAVGFGDIQNTPISPETVLERLCVVKLSVSTLNPARVHIFLQISDPALRVQGPWP